jgi:hypothetical protein
VYAGGIYLTVGYWLITLAICGLLFLIAIDYGVKMEKVNLTVDPGQQATVMETPAVTRPALKTTMGEPRPKKRGSRPPKRRR